MGQLVPDDLGHGIAAPGVDVDGVRGPVIVAILGGILVLVEFDISLDGVGDPAHPGRGVGVHAVSLCRLFQRILHSTGFGGLGI